MTKTPLFVSHASVLLVAFLSLAPLAVAQHEMQPTGQGESKQARSDGSRGDEAVPRRQQREQGRMRTLPRLRQRV